MDNHTPNSIPLKHCSLCKQYKPATTEYFAIQKRTKDGLRSHCKACVKARYGNPKKKAEYDRQYRAKNQERIRAYKKAAYHADVNASREKQRERRAKNREVINQRQNERFRQRYRSDPEFREKQLEQKRAWNREHPDACRDYYQRNAEKIKERAKRWQEAHPERSRQMLLLWH